MRHLAYATAKQKNVDIIVVGEPNKKIIRGNERIKDKRENVVVLFLNKKITVAEVSAGNGFLCMNFGHWDMYCCYISPNINIAEYVGIVDEVAKD